MESSHWPPSKVRLVGFASRKCGNQVTTNRRIRVALATARVRYFILDALLLKLADPRSLRNILLFGGKLKVGIQPIMKRSLRVAVTAIALLLSSAAAAQLVFSGVGRVKDGDSIMVGATEVRLYGIDAPELHQTCQRAGQSWACGAEAKEQLESLAGGRRIECNQVGTDQYQRALARCRVGDIDINRTLVALGYAVAFRRSSLDYASAEESAKVNRRGLWSGTFEMPSEYRHPELARSPSPSRRRPVASRPARTQNSTASTACRIKGNRNRKGQWIYHLPGMPYYEQTGEIFCTEAQAQVAGYRRAIVR